MAKQELIIYEDAMCCSTGICGPEPDKELIQFNQTINKLKHNHPEYTIKRANMSSDLKLFLENEEVLSLVKEKGTEILPITTLNKQIMLTKRYPEKEDFNNMVQTI